MKKLIVTLILLIANYSNCVAQKDFLDFIVTTKNDTIYGAFRDNIEGKILFEKNLNPEKDGIKFYRHLLYKAQSYRINDKIVYINLNKEDGIYATPEDTFSKNLHTKTELQDYVVTLKNDTIFGDIKNPLFASISIKDKSGKKIKIKSSDITSYRFRANLYVHNKKFSAFYFVKKNDFLQLTFNSPVIKVYEYKRNDPINNYTKTFYIVEKNGELTNLNWQTYKSDLSKLLADYPALVNLIMDDVYNLQNIYLIAKYYSAKR